ncbi:uncharacterized protein LOC18009183 [Eutrema salsugineum]|uniref:uncharacterized protein LOC18009183 n=1 Tax=Eutrema salsugineum TaxID=72664 RepID=UPI000CECEE26|nr:uncharacterized protein LOC18009183 [Eutrema salsugineum]XP_024014417.1 uncharacterized protein LOC18009183 [Eutrema salsugineum]
MRKPTSSKVGTTNVKKEIIEIDSDSDTDEVGGGMLALCCGEVSASCKPLNTSAENVETNTTFSMSMVLADDSDPDSGLECDVEYKKYLASYTLTLPSLLEMDTSPMRLMYNVDDEATDRSEGRAVKVGKRRARSPLISSFSKKLKTENGEADHKSISRTVEETKQKKGDARQGRKAALTKNTIKLEPTSDVKDTKQMKEDGRRGRRKSSVIKKKKIESKPTSNLKGTKGRRSYVTNNIFKACKKENEESSAKRNANSQTVLRASKRVKAVKTIPVVNTKKTQRKQEDARRGRKSSVTKINFKACKKEDEEINEKPQSVFIASKRVKAKIGRADHNSISRTIPVFNTKDTKRKKGETSRERKIHVTKTNVKSKSSRPLVKDNLLNSFKARKKEDEESRSLNDKSYEYFLSYLRNSITIFEPDRKVKPEKDKVSLSDPDIIAISNYPFSDGGDSTFQANKDGKVIDLEDGIVPDNILNSSFSKKLLEILRKPYDKNEFLQRCTEASRKRQLTRTRQLRDGKEIEYQVEDQLGPSYLEQYPDFNKKFRHCRYGKDLPRALNLLRGFFFYLENIVLEGAFKPWVHEKLVERECQVIVCIK